VQIGKQGVRILVTSAGPWSLPPIAVSARNAAIKCLLARVPAITCEMARLVAASEWDILRPAAAGVHARLGSIGSAPTWDVSRRLRKHDFVARRFPGESALCRAGPLWARDCKRSPGLHYSCRRSEHRVNRAVQEFQSDETRLRTAPPLALSFLGGRFPMTSTSQSDWFLCQFLRRAGHVRVGSS